MLGYEGLINSENQFTSSFDIQFGPTNFIFREDGFFFPRLNENLLISEPGTTLLKSTCLKLNYRIISLHASTVQTVATNKSRKLFKT